MTKKFDARNAEKSRAVCEAMAKRADTGKRVLTERERRLIHAWPRHEGSGRLVWLGDSFADEKGEVHEIEGITLYSHGIDIFDDEGFHKGLDYGECLKRPDPVARDANGEPICDGCTVYDVRGERFTVTGIYGDLLELRQDDVVICPRMPADQFSIAPRDSWMLLEMEAESIRKNIALHLGDYSPSCYTRSGDSIQDRVLALVCRAKALAGAEAGR